MTKKEMVFLGSRLTQLREKNGVKSLQAMMDLLNNSGNDEYAVYNKSTLSRVESASVGEMFWDTLRNKPNYSLGVIKSLCLIHQH